MAVIGKGSFKKNDQRAYEKSHRDIVGSILFDTTWPCNVCFLRVIDKEQKSVRLSLYLLELHLTLQEDSQGYYMQLDFQMIAKLRRQRLGRTVVTFPASTQNQPFCIMRCSHVDTKS